MKKILITILLSLSLLALTACRGSDDDENIIFVTSYPIKFLVEELGKGLVTVKYVPGSNVHQHSTDWSGQEIIDMQDADLLFYVGSGLDPYIEQQQSTLQEKGLPLIRLIDYVNPIEICVIDDHDHDDHDDNDHHNDHNGHDEHDHECEHIEDAHFWLDVNRMITIAEVIKDQLILAYSSQESLILNNYAVLNLTLQKLHETYVEALENATKPLITNVKLFTYYQDGYGLDIHPLTKYAHAHDQETIPGDLIHYVDFAIDNNIMYILFEKHANSPAGDALLSSLQSTVPEAGRLDLHPLGVLTSDEITLGKNYINIMLDNLEALLTALKN